MIFRSDAICGCAAILRYGKGFVFGGFQLIGSLLWKVKLYYSFTTNQLFSIGDTHAPLHFVSLCLHTIAASFRIAVAI